MSEFYLSPEFAQATLETMQSNNPWFISELDDLTRKAIDATQALAEHRQSMRNRETIMAKLKEMTR